MLSIRHRVVRDKFVKLMLFGGIGWLFATTALVLLGLGVVSLFLAACLALAGAVVTFALAASRSLIKRQRRFRPPDMRGPSATTQAPQWADIANPASHYANRWAMYQDLSVWLSRQDFTGKKVAEVGSSNEILYTFMRDAEHVVLPYPEYDVQDLTQVADREFDFMILDQTLEHLQNPEKALSEVHRVLKPGGVAIITTPFFIPVHPGEGYGDYYRWTPQGMKVVLERCGFEPEVHMWGNLKAAQALLADMYMLADEATRQRLDISTALCDERFPVSVWATATARK